MTKSYEPGGDAKAISRIVREHFDGQYKVLFEQHGWELLKGQHYMHQAAPRIVEAYGSIAAFERHFDNGGTV